MRKAAPPRRVWSLWRQYGRDTQRPLYCLIFLLPLITAYELGALILRPAVWPERQLVAHSLIQRLLGWFGATGFWLPAVVLLATLLIWQLARGYPWRVHAWVLLLMPVESVILTAPLFALGQVLLQAGTVPRGLALWQETVLALGAGIYEELVFRFYLMGSLAWLLERGLHVSRKIGTPVVIVLSAVLFAVCHFTPIGREPFAWMHVLLLLLAGAYLGLIFMRRGLGVAVGCHVAYNLLPYLLR
jgi:membrane protease YdiL (CAAX protease family)